MCLLWFFITKSEKKEIVSYETIAFFLPLEYIIYSTTFILEPGQSWKTAALRVPKCVCFFVSCETLYRNGDKFE